MLINDLNPTRDLAHICREHNLENLWLDDRQISMCFNLAVVEDPENVISKYFNKNLEPSANDSQVALRIENTRIRLSSIYYIKHGHPLRERGIRKLAPLLKVTLVKALCLNDNCLGSHGAEILGQNLEETQIRDLSLSNNNIGVKGIKGLAPHIKELVRLNLNNNNIGHEGAAVLANHLGGTMLKYLYLKSNQLKSKGAIAIAKKLSDTQLEGLDLDQNFVGNKGAESIANSLKLSKLTWVSFGRVTRVKRGEFDYTNMEIVKSVLSIKGKSYPGEKGKQALYNAANELSPDRVVRIGF